MKKFWIFFIILLGLLTFSIFSTSFGNEEIDQNEQLGSSQNQSFSTGKVTANSLKIRSGLGTEYDFIGLLAKDDILHIYAKEGNWYIIKTQNNLIGAVSADYIEVSPETEEAIETSAKPETTAPSSVLTLSQDEQIFFNLINNKRIENNLPEFELDETLLNLARLKANDLVENNYFSHTSPKLGSLYEMLLNNQVSYSNASENIARNINANSAIESLMNSEAHKNNLLSENFNYTGIAVVNSIDWGKVFVQIFVAR